MIRNIESEDLSQIRALVKRCEPLGFHTLYTYWVLNYHFNDLFLVSEQDSRLNGMITGLMSRRSPRTAFVWQIGVDPESRGRGIAQALIREFCARARTLGAETVLVTVDPENEASFRAFEKYARAIKGELRKVDTLEIDDYFSDYPEREDVYALELL